MSESSACGIVSSCCPVIPNVLNQQFCDLIEFFLNGAELFYIFSEFRESDFCLVNPVCYLCLAWAVLCCVSGSNINHIFYKMLSLNSVKVILEDYNAFSTIFCIKLSV